MQRTLCGTTLHLQGKAVLPVRHYFAVLPVRHYFADRCWGMQRLVDTQEQLMQLHKLALAFQEGSEGCYIYGQDDSAPEASPQGQELSNGHHAAMRCAQPS